MVVATVLPFFFRFVLDCDAGVDGPFTIPFGLLLRFLLRVLLRIVTAFKNIQF